MSILVADDCYFPFRYQYPFNSNSWNNYFKHTTISRITMFCDPSLFFTQRGKATN